MLGYWAMDQERVGRERVSRMAERRCWEVWMAIWHEWMPNSEISSMYEDHSHGPLVYPNQLQTPPPSQLSNPALRPLTP